MIRARSPWLLAAVTALALGALVPFGGTAGAASDSTPINIGVVCSCVSALASSNGAAVPGFEAWAHYVNAHGGINGHPVNVIVKNDNLSPITALQETQNLVTQDHVVAIAQNSDVDDAITPYVDKVHMPVVGLGASATQSYTNWDFFAPGQTNDSSAFSSVLAAKQIGAKKIGIMYCVEAAVCSSTIPQERQIAQKEGVDLAYVAGISASAPNYTAECLAAKQAGVQALSVADGASVTEKVAMDCVEQGYHPRFIEGDGGITLAFASAPGLSNGTIAPETDIPMLAKTPGTEEMFAAFKKYEPGQLLGNPSYNELAVTAWVDGLLIQAAAKAGHLGVNGPPTTTELYNGLYSLHGVTLDGMSPPLTFKRGVPNPVDCWYTMETVHGHFETPYGLGVKCEK